MATGPTTDAEEPTQPLHVLRRGPDPSEPAREGSAYPRTDPATPTGPAWVVLGARRGERPAATPVSSRRILVQLVVGVAVILTAITVGGTFAARRLAEREAVNDAAGIADVLAETTVQPALTDRLLAGDAGARRAFDDLVRSRVLGDAVVRLKIWSTDGRVLYADQADLVGRRFGLDPEEREVLREPRTVAEISDLSRPENALDRAAGDKLVEVYRPVWTPSGQQALFEIYTPYDQVSARTGQLWRGFAGVTLTSLLLFLVLLAPLVWHLLTRAREAQRQREHLLTRTIDAQDEERRRIAGTLHDGPVQDLAATSFVIAGATARAEAEGREDLAGDLRGAAGSVRTSIRALRTLLVDLYPPSLSRAGLAVALGDLAQTVRAPGLQVVVDVPDDPAGTSLGLDADGERLVHRVAQETLRNAAKHAAPGTVRLAVARTGDEVVLEVVDDGPGFDVDAVLRSPEAGHLGVGLLSELAEQSGARLRVASAPGAGTRWELRVPTAAAEERRLAGGRRSWR